MRIITITFNDLGISWGPAIHFLELWNCVAARNPKLRIVGFAPSWTRRPPILRPQFALGRIGVSNVAKLRQVIYDLRIAWQLLTLRRSDLVYLRVGHFHVFSTLVLRLRRNPLILELNGLLIDDAISAKRSRSYMTFIRWQESALVRRAQGLIAVSRGIADAMVAAHRPSARILVVKNGVGMQFFNDQVCAPPDSGIRQASAKVTVLYVGTFTPWDGAAKIVELARNFPEIHFQFVGDGPARSTVEASATENMTFVGSVSYADLPRYYRSADAGIVLYEARRHKRVHLSSLKTLEYLASGLPVFTTNVPGQELVSDLGCGMLASEESLVEDFNRFLQALPTYRRAAEAAKPLIRQKHSWESAANDTEAFISSIARAEHGDFARDTAAAK